MAKLLLISLALSCFAPPHLSFALPFSPSAPQPLESAAPQPLSTQQTSVSDPHILASPALELEGLLGFRSSDSWPPKLSEFELQAFWGAEDLRGNHSLFLQVMQENPEEIRGIEEYFGATAQAWESDDECPGFNALGQQYVRGSFYEFQMIVAKAMKDADLKPVDVVRARRMARILMTMLEIFSPVYPVPERGVGEQDSPDVWVMMLSDVVHAKDKFGKFEDLGYEQPAPTPKEMKKMRKHLFDWYTMWNNHVELYNYTGYLEMVSTTARYKHEGESYLFWGGSLPPYPDAGGMASIQTLVRKQLIHATILAKQVEKLKSIAETENFNQALEFMKICRALVDESLVFGRGLITPSSPSSRALNVGPEIDSPTCPVVLIAFIGMERKSGLRPICCSYLPLSLLSVLNVCPVTQTSPLFDSLPSRSPRALDSGL